MAARARGRMAGSGVGWRDAQARGCRRLWRRPRSMRPTPVAADAAKRHERAMSDTSDRTRTVYKIVDAEIWREAEAACAFGGAGIDLTDGYIHLSTGPQSARDGRQALCGAREPRAGGGGRDAAGRGDGARRCATSPRAGATCSRTCTARCRWTAWRGSARCRSGPTAHTRFPTTCERAFDASRAPSRAPRTDPARHRARRAGRAAPAPARGGAPRLARRARPRWPPRAPAARGPTARRDGPELPLRAGRGGGLRQGCRGAGRPAAARLRPCRGGHAHAAPAAGEPAPARLPPARRPGNREPLRLQQCGPRRGARPAARRP